MDYVKKNIVNFKEAKEEEKQELANLRGFVKITKLHSFP
jgi:hypothetical protein